MPRLLCLMPFGAVDVVTVSLMIDDSGNYVSFVFCRGYFLFSTESLILAQDERWRRA